MSWGRTITGLAKQVDILILCLHYFHSERHILRSTLILKGFVGYYRETPKCITKKGLPTISGRKCFLGLQGKFSKNDEEKVSKGKTWQTKRENITIDKIPEHSTFSEVLHLPFSFIYLNIVLKNLPGHRAAPRVTSWSNLIHSQSSPLINLP